MLLRNTSAHPEAPTPQHRRPILGQSQKGQIKMSPITYFIEGMARSELSIVRATGLELEIARLRAKQRYLTATLTLIIDDKNLDLDRVQSRAFEALEDIRTYDKEIEDL
jgi:hypothetical protein